METLGEEDGREGEASAMPVGKPVHSQGGYRRQDIPKAIGGEGHREWWRKLLVSYLHYLFFFFLSNRIPIFCVPS